MRRSLILFVVMFFFFFKIACAHNPLSAMYYLEVKEDVGILNISLSQAGFNEALKKKYSDIKLDELSSNEYKKLAVKYIKDNFYLTINGNRVKLLDGGLKLGNHQTDVKFITNELPKQFNTLAVKIDAFVENGNHQTVFSVLTNKKTSKVILNKKNNYKASVEFVDHIMVTDSNTFNKNYLWFMVIIPTFLVGKKYIVSR